MREKKSEDEIRRLDEAVLARLTEASIELLDGESLDAYRGALCTAVGEALEALGVIARNEDGDLRPWWYVPDATATYALVEIEEHCLRMDYVRQPGGTFAFGVPVEVRRVVSYEPVAPEMRKYAFAEARRRPAPVTEDDVLLGAASARSTLRAAIGESGGGDAVAIAEAVGLARRTLNAEQGDFGELVGLTLDLSDLARGDLEGLRSRQDADGVTTSTTA